MVITIVDGLLTLDFRFRHGIQALEIQRRLDGGSNPAARDSGAGEEEPEPGSALGKMGRGALDFMITRGGRA